MQNFAQMLIEWYELEQRDLPWRNTTDPYAVWLSEIILQQTRVDQGLPYYERFLSAFPTVNDLANADEDQVMRLWQGLGYYSRARNLKKTAEIVSGQLNGKFPQDFPGLRSLPGIGDYTAAAIASFCFNVPTPVVDGNVYRVLSRIFDVAEAIDMSKGKKLFSSLAHDLIDKENPAAFNQAMMEFGALHCTPKTPACGTCIFQNDCQALRNETVYKRPVKTKKTGKKTLHFHYIFPHFNTTTYLKKRTKKGIWNNLYEFPLIELDQPASRQSFIRNQYLEGVLGNKDFNIKSIAPPVKHILSHRIIHCTFWRVELEKEPEQLLSDGFTAVPINKIGSFALPRLIDRYLETQQLP